MSIQFYLRILGARKKLILSVTIVAFVGSVLLALIWPNAYESSVRVHVQPVPPPADQEAGFYYSQEYFRQLIAQYNIEDFAEIVEGLAFAADIAEIIAQSYDLQLTPREISDSLSIEQDSRLLELTFTSSDPRVAQALADAAETILETRAGDLFASVRKELVSVQIVDPASEPEATSLARLGLDIFARTLVAFLLVTGFAFVLEVLSGLCRSREDVEEELRIPVLANIPPIPEHLAASGHSDSDET